jgi:PKD repeat protein
MRRAWWAVVVASLACGGGAKQPSRPAARSASSQTVAPTRGVTVVAGFDGTAGQGLAPDTERFDASGSHSLDPNAQLSFAWDFGDGAGATGAKVEHTYGAAGVYTAKVTVTDSDGASSSGSVAVVVHAPATTSVEAVARFDGTVGEGTVPDTERFDGSGSTSSDASATVFCNWDFGDGASAQGCHVEHTFGTPGQFTVTMIATDSHGASGTANLAVEVQSNTGVRWTRSFDAPAALVASPTGQLFASVASTDANHDWTATGYLLGTDGADHGAFPLAFASTLGDLPHLVSASDDRLYALAVVSTEWGPWPQLDVWTQDGQRVGMAYSGTDISSYEPFAFSPGNDLVMRAGNWGNVGISFGGADGTSWSTPLPAGVAIEQLAFAPNGNIVADGSASSPWSLWGRDFAGGPFIVELDRTGALVWAVELQGAAGGFKGLGTSALGTVVAVAQLSGAYAWGAVAGTTGDVLLTVEIDGQPRWTRALPPTTGAGWQLAIDPSGKAALYGLEGNGSCTPKATILRYDLAGDALASRTVRALNCSDRLALGAIVFSHHHVVIAGESRFGTTVSAPGGFVTELSD